MSTAYEHLRQRVVSGDLRPGNRLAEIPLAGELGVSRPTVREALRRLESSGLATSDGRSLCVAHLEARELRSALLMRASLEALHASLAAARVAAGQIAPAQLRAMLALADATEQATASGDFDRTVKLNRDFHQAVDDLADSPVSAAAVDGLWDRIVVSTRESLFVRGRPSVVSREHRAILRAIRAGDEERAARAAGEHVRGTTATTLADGRRPGRQR